MRTYVDTEHRDKKGKPFDFIDWVDWEPQVTNLQFKLTQLNIQNLKDTPRQDNYYDCGVFACQFLETISRGEDQFLFSQKDIPYLRRRMIWEIGKAQLLYN